MQSAPSVGCAQTPALFADPVQSAEKAHVEVPHNSSTGSVDLEPGTGVMGLELEPGVQGKVGL